MILQKSLHSPFGDLTLTQDGDTIISLDWGAGRDQSESSLLNKAIAQLHAYFDGESKTFDLPLAPPVTAFTRSVLTQMQAIPYGETRTYAQIAKSLNTAPRAVGGACGRNPIPIIIPCHRVLSVTGMGGYSGDGGLDTKQALLTLEGALKTGH